jgi:hypothetical protein
MSDLDVITFVQGVWVPAHRENCRTRMGAGGEKVTSVSTERGDSAACKEL